VDTFTIEGRSAPALFVVGWLTSILGLGAMLIAFLSGSDAATVLLVIGLVLLSIGLVAGAGSQAIERRAKGVLPYQGPSPFLVFAASVPISILAAIVIGVPLSILGMEPAAPLGIVVTIAVQTLVYFGLVRLLVVDVGALSWADMGIRRPDGRALAELGAGALWSAPVILATLPLAAIITTLVPDVRPVSPLPPTGDPTGLVLNLVAGAILAPIGEEILFRGFATTAWARGIGARSALVRGALFFAIAHILTVSGANAGEAAALAAIAFVSRIPVALVLGWLFLRRGSIWVPIGLHAAFNGILIVLGELALQMGAEVPAIIG
jgi:membrane protease YdiL (CAAX protease family)